MPNNKLLRCVIGRCEDGGGGGTGGGDDEDDDKKQTDLEVKISFDLQVPCS